MSNSLKIFGAVFNNVTGIKTQDENGNEYIYTIMWTEQTISTNGAVTQTLDPYVLYHFTGSLTSLTVTLGQAQGVACYHFDFNCGASAPTVNIPNTVKMPDGQTFDANNHYEVDILNNYGAALSWAIS